MDRIQNTSKARPEALQAEQAHGFILGLEVEKRGDLHRAGSARLLPLAAATLPGSWPRTQLVAHHHDDIYPNMQE